MSANRTSPENREIADILEQIATLLDTQGANPFRIQAYRDGAETVRTAEESIAKLSREEGEEGLQGLPDIGEAIARVIHSFIDTGRSDFLEQLQSEVTPDKVLQQVPGIGKKLSARIVKELDVSTLQELEQAAHDGRLLKVKGIGAEMVQNIQIGLAGMLSTAAQRTRRQARNNVAAKQAQPEIAVLLAVDEEYRRKAEEGHLKKIAPKRFNPEGKAWLPILNTNQAGWKFTALYSNTAQAHKLEKTDNWVVLYYERNGIEEQATVVTETKGDLAGKRVIRGREEESYAYYQK